jgi:hypothetical protein
MASALTSEAAVDEWILKYPALKELDEKEIWFRPMMNVVAKRLLAEVPWGLKMRVFVSAGLSILDLFSDVSVIFLYLNTPGNEVYGWVLLTMLSFFVAILLLGTYLQHRSRPLVALSEMLISLSGLKPG